MFSFNLQSICVKCSPINQINIFRYVRSIVRRGDGPKVIQVRSKTVTQYDESERIGSYKDLVRSVQNSNLGDELEIEKHFLNEDYHGHIFENVDKYYDTHLSEQKSLKSFIKKKIIGRKYFKLDQETNLLTYAAKQQIRFLHNSNPLEWNCKALSECFPISEAGVKKLLKCNFKLTCPEKIKAHDENVARKWEILKSGKPSDEISVLTRKLYREGKLVDDYFSGNPNLPAVPPPNKKVIEFKKKVAIGEFSAIVQTYHDYEKKKTLGSKESEETQVSVRDNNFIGIPKKNERKNKNAFKFKVASEEYDDNDANPDVYPVPKKKIVNDNAIPFSQFKEILKEENELKSTNQNAFTQQISSTNQNTPEETEDSQNCFIKIPKYEKENVDLMFEKGKFTNIYKYDDKLGYQYPVGKSIKAKINVSSELRKGRKLLKVGKCIYDENGEFLCKVPT